MMHLGPTEEQKSTTIRLLSFKIGEPGISSVIYMDYSFHKLDQVYMVVKSLLCMRNWSAGMIWHDIKVLDSQP